MKTAYKGFQKSVVKIFTDLLHGIEPNNIKLNQMMELIEFLLQDSKTDPKHKSELFQNFFFLIIYFLKIFLSLNLVFLPLAALRRVSKLMLTRRRSRSIGSDPQRITERFRSINFESGPS